jgi:hypothetical protein
MRATPIDSSLAPARWLRVLRWSARILGLLMVGTVLFFAVGEGLNLSKFPPGELVLFGFFPLGVGLGMLLAWRWELLGGGITVASLAACYLVERLESSSFPRGPAFLFLAAPGVLFLLCGWRTRSARLKKHGADHEIRRQSGV